MALNRLFLAGAFISCLLQFIIFLLPNWRQLYPEKGLPIKNVIDGLWVRCFKGMTRNVAEILDVLRMKKIPYIL